MILLSLLGQDGWILAKLRDRDIVEVQKRAKSGLERYTLILTEHACAWSIKDVFHCALGNIFLYDDNGSLARWVANHSAGFCSTCSLAEGVCHVVFFRENSCGPDRAV